MKKWLWLFIMPLIILMGVLFSRVLLANTAPEAGLVSWWSGEGSANDDVVVGGGGGGNNGILTLSANAVNGAGGVTFAPGKVGQGF